MPLVPAGIRTAAGKRLQRDAGLEESGVTEQAQVPLHRTQPEPGKAVALQKRVSSLNKHGPVSNRAGYASALLEQSSDGLK